MKSHPNVTIQVTGGGSGIGLMLAQNFINQHKGLIEFDSHPGATCFTLLLPVTDSEY